MEATPNMLIAMQELVSDSHRSQTYYNAPLTHHLYKCWSTLVGLGCDDIKLQCAMIGMRLIDNTSITYTDIEERFSADVSYIVSILTMPSNTTYVDYISSICHSDTRIRLLKLIDLVCDVNTQIKQYATIYETGTGTNDLSEQRKMLDSIFVTSASIEHIVRSLDTTSGYATSTQVAKALKKIMKSIPRL